MAPLDRAGELTRVADVTRWQRRAAWLAVAAGAVFAAGVASGEPKEPRTYAVGLAEDGFEPFTFSSKTSGKEPPRDGIFVQLLKEIGALTGDRFEFIYAPNNRLKSYFERDKIAVEPGINPAWRQEQAAISVYSAPFADLTERLLFHEATGVYALGDFIAGKKPAGSGASAAFLDPKARLLGTVRGYFYPKLDAAFKDGTIKRIDAEGERAILRMLEGRRVDAVVIAEIPARYHLRAMEKHRIRMGEEIDRTPIMFRVHKAHDDLRARIDKALAELKARGRVDEIVRSFIGE